MAQPDSATAPAGMVISRISKSIPLDNGSKVIYRDIFETLEIPIVRQDARDTMLPAKSHNLGIENKISP